MGPHFHISGLNVLIYALSAILILGLLNLAAMKHKDDSSFWASWANLYGVD